MIEENLSPEASMPAETDSTSADSSCGVDTTHSSPTEGLSAEALHAELTSLRDEFDLLRNQHIRTLADFQNFRKRKESELAASRAYATEKLVLDLLPVLDNFRRTVEALQQGSSLDSIKSGIIAVERQFVAALEGHNVRAVDALGQPFDPEMHEAISHEPSTEHPDETVIHVLEQGYKMADRVIRPARVRVSKKP